MNETSYSRFVTKKQNIINDQSNTKYSVANEIIYSTEVLKSKLYDFSNAYILARGNITDVAASVTQILFKNFAPLLSVSKKLIEQQ